MYNETIYSIHFSKRATKRKYNPTVKYGGDGVMVWKSLAALGVVN